jgi:succinoglycan biosynthesis transport protein ExoP
MSDAYGSEQESGGGDGIIAYLPSILWQRRWWIIVPLVLCTLAGIAAAFLLPSTYRSSATLLVESPQLPTELVGSPATSLIDKRIAKVRQQVLSRPDLIELIENNNLYSEERQHKPLSEVIDQMRKSTSISPVSADIGGQGSNTIAFSLTFDYPDSQKAQLVAQDFVERLVRLDATQTAQQATGTVEFLQEQANSLSSQITAIERQIEGIKAANGAALSGSNTMMLGSGGGGYQAQIAGIQRDNAQLNAQLKLQSTAVDRDPAVAAAEAQLAGARAVYSDNHPDVHLAEQRLAEAKRFAATNIKKFNPYSSVQQQIAANNSAIAQLQAAQNSDQARTGAVMSAQARGPAINEQIAQLQSKADGLRTNYQTVATNLINARGTAKLSEQQKGERLSVIDPPVAADRPSWPNRPLLIVGGIAVGAALGLLIAFVLELIMQPIRGVGSLQKIIGEPPLVIVPKLSSRTRGFRWPWRRREMLPSDLS